jgi:AcrR family transcriptional regulator
VDSTEPTAWGDAEGRRRDILRSVEELLAGSGYAALTMRAIAVGAGVSSGTCTSTSTARRTCSSR